MTLIRLKRWAFITPTREYALPTSPVLLLTGEVYDHPRFPDGTPVVTSLVGTVERQRAFTLNTEYHLCDPSPEFGEWLDTHGVELAAFVRKAA